MEEIDCVVVGAGVVGLAIARALAIAGREVIVLEAADQIGTETSSRNSEVIHAGIYYPKNALKAQLCVQGKKALYAYCDRKHIAYRRCGKLIVATHPAQVDTLVEIQATAAANGVGDLRLLTRGQVRALEPAVECVGALMSPSTGIIDSHAFMLALQADAEHAGALFVFSSPVLGGAIAARGIHLELGGTDPAHFCARTVINCAGLHAQGFATGIRGVPRSHIPPLFLAKGSYFSLATAERFEHLVYPVPEQAGLGIHLTIDLGGQVRFGPDVEWVTERDYRVDLQRVESFYPAIRKYWPGLRDEALHPAYSGIRPKISGPNAPASDFRIDGPHVHGVPGLVNLFGIESPGLTASLAIADRVAALLHSERSAVGS